MSTIFINSQNSKTSDAHRLTINLMDKIYSQKVDNRVVSSNLRMYYTGKNITASHRNNKFKI